MAAEQCCSIQPRTRIGVAIGSGGTAKSLTDLALPVVGAGREHVLGHSVSLSLRTVIGEAVLPALQLEAKGKALGLASSRIGEAASTTTPHSGRVLEEDCPVDDSILRNQRRIVTGAARSSSSRQSCRSSTTAATPHFTGTRQTRDPRSESSGLSSNQTRCR